MSGLTGARENPRFRFMLLDSTDADIRDISEQIIGGSLSLTTGRLGGSGSLQLDDAGIDFGSQRVRISYDPGVDGADPWDVGVFDGLIYGVSIPKADPWDVGVFLFASPTRTLNGLHPQVEVGLLSKLQVPEEGSTVGTSGISAGSSVIGTVEALVRSTGETRLAVTPSQRVLAEPYTADANKSLLSICNELLDAAGYWGLSVNPAGQYVIEPYQAPAARPVVWTFTEDEASIISSEQTDEKDMLSVPNQFVAYTTGTDDEPPLVGVAQDTNPLSPFSIPSRGRVIEARDSVEAASQSDADAIAARRLLALQAPIGRRTVSHAMIPVRPREVVEHVRGDGTRARFTIQKLDFTFDFDTQMKAEWNEVQA